ncbi:LacI family DNA-binding transcriptional regulator [Rhizobium rhizogenes]|jgi:DNA-binding LacI/PurR family transcriptional regulator|uniref:LacI family DNA-binding transcriptional regulator n=1 Tax=Rhizobium rhizogenes TaxID=359 RepID=UPI0015726678|nr:LacI family DNA-binding transcriptional regulator [Rhizobium rhizogenes]NTG45458.1 LacI family transcriptional regulator [Rhizobium rhizogenes]
MQNGKPTMADVARVANVSPTTAARVVHGNGYVSKENRTRVLAAVETLSYRPNLQARSLRTQRSFTLGLVLSSARENPFFAKLSHALRTTARSAGYSMLTVNHSHSAETEADGVRQFLEHQVEAVVACHAFNPGNFTPIVENGIPIIQIEREVVPQTHLVTINPRPGLQEALSDLVAGGHRRVAFLGGNDLGKNRLIAPTLTERERAETFLAVASEMGLDVGECPILLGDYVPPATDERLPGYELANQLLGAGGVLPVTAIIAGSDILAAGILQALYERGVRIPHDCSLVGYDDSLARFLAPALTSIAQPYESIARAVVEIATSLDTDGPLLRRQVKTGLVRRDSIGPAPGTS